MYVLINSPYKLIGRIVTEFYNYKSKCIKIDKSTKKFGLNKVWVDIVQIWTLQTNFTNVYKFGSMIFWTQRFLDK